MSALSEDGLIILVNRIEALAGKACRAAETEARNGSLMERNRKLRADFEAAEEKIGEWAEYASKLRDIIAAGQKSGKDKRKVIALPPMPKPFETEIPF